MAFVANRWVLVAVVFISIAIYINRNKQKRYLPWHESSEWQRFLQVYDGIAAKQFEDCTIHSISTRFGSTRLYACGDSTNQAVILLPGAASNALLYGDWLSPALKTTHYTLSVDFVCDVGRSVPQNGNPENCPQNEQELAEWIKEILEQMDIKEPVSVIGYSYGSFIAACAALAYPEMVDRMIFIAPAAVFAPIEFSWIWRAIAYGLMPTDFMQQWFFKYMSADPQFNLQTSMSREALELTVASRDVGGTVLAVNVRAFEDVELAQIARQHAAMLIVGEEETVLNATLAVETAKKAGVSVKLYPRTGHLLLMEHARENVGSVVQSFLNAD